MPQPLPHIDRFPLRRLGLLLAAVALLAACAGAPPSTAPGIALGLDDATPTGIRGGTVQVAVGLTRLGGASAAVDLSLTGLPANVSATFAPPSLSGTASESTLTLSVDAAAVEGTFDLTVTGTAGTLADDAELTLTVASLTVTGTVEQTLWRPLVGATIASQGQSTFSNASGAFTLTGLTLPYDLVVSAPIGDGGIHVYEGMTTPTPRVRPAFAFFGGPPSGFGATIAGLLAGGALGAGEVVIACVEGLAIPAYGCDVLTSGDVDFSIGATWFDTATTSVRLHALHIAVDGDGVPTAYLGYDAVLLDLSDGDVTVTGLDFEPVASGTLTGTTSHPEGATNQGLIVMARFGPNLSMHFAQIQDPGPAFEVLVPVLPGLSYDVYFGASVTSTSVNTWKLDAGLDAGTFDVAAPAQMVAPADGAIGVDLATTFSSTSAGGARTYAWAPVAAGPVIALTTTRTSVTLPDPALGGFALPAGADYTWTVIGHGADGVDTAIAGGFADYVNLLFSTLVSGGPGFDGDRTFSLPGTGRTLTLAP